MEYYNEINKEYLTAIRRPMRVMKIKVELLDKYDNAIGYMENYLSSADGSITVNLSQGCRRSCNITVVDTDRKYIPQKDSLFWYNRKFKIYIGLQAPSGNLYWFPQGVFYTQNASTNGREITIDGIDKYGMLNGELNSNMCEMKYQAKLMSDDDVDEDDEKKKKDIGKGIKVVDLIRETLALDMGDGYPIDTTEPLIDSVFYNEILYQDVAVDEGSYIGDLFDKIADMYGAYIYYDVDGHLRMEKIFNDDKPYWYIHLASEYDFGKVDISEDTLDVENKFDAYNTVTVVTDNTEGFIYSYTARNRNPMSPVNVDAIGIRRYKNGSYAIPLSSSNDTSPSEKCRQQAQYLLMQSICNNLSVSFNYPIIPHLDVDRGITLTNEYFGFERKPFVIQSMTFNLNGEPTSYEVVNVQWLPLDSITLKPEVNYTQVRFVIAATRSGAKNSRLSELTFYSANEDGTKGNIIPIKKVYTKNKVINKKLCKYIIDDNQETETDLKFFTSNKIIIDIYFKEASTIAGYDMITSCSKETDYDPRTWRVYGKNDDTDYVLLEKREGISLPEKRKALVDITIGGDIVYG